MRLDRESETDESATNDELYGYHVHMFSSAIAFACMKQVCFFLKHSFSADGFLLCQTTKRSSVDASHDATEHIDSLGKFAV